MTSKQIALRVVSVSAIAGITAFSGGCARSEDISDEFSRISSQEVSNMDANSSGMITQGGTAKLEAAATDTVTYDLTIHPFAWDTVAGDTFAVRTATLTCSDGYERVRVDTLTFYDHNGNTMRHPTLATVDSIHHVRHVTRDKGGNELNITVNMHSTVSAITGQAGNYTHVKNGTITGTFNGEQAATGTITNVTRNYISGHWQLFPQSGSITADFPHRTYEIDFLGAGEVKLTITDLSTDKTKVETIIVDQQ